MELYNVSGKLRVFRGKYVYVVLRLKPQYIMGLVHVISWAMSASLVSQARLSQPQRGSLSVIYTDWLGLACETS